jgi:hypothetical protein
MFRVTGDHPGREPGLVVQELHQNRVFREDLQHEWVVRLAQQPETPVRPGTALRSQSRVEQEVLIDHERVEQALAARGRVSLDLHQGGVLMIADPHRLAAQRGQQFPDARRGRDPDPYRQRVEHQPDQRVGSGHGVAAHRTHRSEDDVVAVQVAVQQHGPGGLDHRVEGAAALARHRAEPVGQFLGQLQVVFGVPDGGGPSTILGDQGRAGQAGHRRAPEVTLGRAVPSGQPVDERAVRHGRRQFGERAASQRVVRAEHLPQEQQQRPSVEHRVVEGEQEPYGVRIPVYGPAHQRRPVHPESVGPIGAQERLPRPGDRRDGERHRRVYLLQDLAVAADPERGPQSVVPVRGPLPCVGEDLDIQIGLQDALHLDGVEAGSVRERAVGDDAQLHGRQRIDVDRAVGHGGPPRLRQLA